MNKKFNILIHLNLLKNKKEFDKDNFRPISVSNVLAQILERIVLMKRKAIEKTSKFQFKQRMSTMHPLLLLKELIAKHQKERIPLYIASLDSEKAYDSVWRDGMFFKLREAMDPIFWVILKDFYDKSDGVFKINGKTDPDVIKVSRGVKQRGVLSPKLFNFFIDELIEEIIQLGFGCKIMDKRVPIMGYCDDTMLIESPINRLEKKVECCEKYSMKGYYGIM